MIHPWFKFNTKLKAVVFILVGLIIITKVK